MRSYRVGGVHLDMQSDAFLEGEEVTTPCTLPDSAWLWCSMEQNHASSWVLSMTAPPVPLPSCHVMIPCLPSLGDCLFFTLHTGRHHQGVSLCGCKAQ